jgi:hypothetical protein
LDSIGRIRRLNQAFLNRVAPQRFVFHHVPKCGGTSVAKALRKRYLTSQATVKPEPSFRAFEAYSGRHDTEEMLVDVNDLRKQMMLYLLYDDVRCVSLHVPFSEVAHRLFHDRYKFITILRDPVERFVSHYNWSSRRPNSHGHIPEDFDTFITTKRARLMGAEYVEMFADLPNGSDLRTSEAASGALKNLRKFDIVGRLDDLDGFAGALHRELGVRVRIGHENKAHKSRSFVARTDLNSEQIRALDEICAPDIAIWKEIFGGL